MFSTGANYGKLKTNLRLAINRLKLLEKKKTELAQKARKEIADYIAAGKYERAKIRVEHIIREDYLVEAMEVVEMYCDLLLARFGLIEQMKSLDEGLSEAVSSLIWVTPRLQADVAELKIISDQLTAKYGKPYAQAARENALRKVNDKLMLKLSVESPPKILVENYLIEIAKSHNVEYEPDQEALQEEQNAVEAVPGETPLIDLGEGTAPLAATGVAGGFTYPQMPNPPAPPVIPFNYPSSAVNSGEKPPIPSSPPSAFPPDIGFNIPPPYDTVVEKPPYKKPSSAPSNPATDVMKPPTPAPRTKFPVDTLPELPSVPTNSLPNLDEAKLDDPGEDVDFDDLTKRFEELKKRK